MKAKPTRGIGTTGAKSQGTKKPTLKSSKR